jgi:putative transposase
VKDMKDMKRNFSNNKFYHLYDRGVDKRRIYLNNEDNIRFIHDLYEFNNTKPAPQFIRRFKKIHLGVGNKKSSNVGSETSNITTSNIASSVANGICDAGFGFNDIKIKNRQKRDLLVNVYAFVLMPNHHHLLVEQLRDNGISNYIRKLHTGYANAFNSKYERKGHLFEGPFKAVHVEDDIQLGCLICYLHSNPLSLWKSNWREKKLTDLEINQALKFLEKYKWSSHLDYIGIKNFESIIDRDFLLDFFDGIPGYKAFFVDWLKQHTIAQTYMGDYIIE